MATDTNQSVLFDDPYGGRSDTVHINGRCRISTQDGFRVVSISGIPLYHYAEGDRMAEAHAMVSLIEQGVAKQTEVARAFCCTTRTVRRYQERFAEGGLSALGRSAGYPKGKPRLRAARSRLVSDLRSKGVSVRKIAARIGVSEKAVRKQLRRLGWQPADSKQLSLPIPGESGADPNLSAFTCGDGRGRRCCRGDSILVAGRACGPKPVRFSAGR